MGINNVRDLAAKVAFPFTKNTPSDVTVDVRQAYAPNTKGARIPASTTFVKDHFTEPVPFHYSNNPAVVAEDKRTWFLHNTATPSWENNQNLFVSKEGKALLEQADQAGLSSLWIDASPGGSGTAEEIQIQRPTLGDKAFTAQTKVLNAVGEACRDTILFVTGGKR